MNRRSFLARAMAGLGVTAVVGASALNPLAPEETDGRDSSEDVSGEDPTPTRKPTPTPEPTPYSWRNDLSGTVGGLAIDTTGGDLYVSLGTDVYRIDGDSGDIRWQTPSEQSIESPVALGDDAVFATGRRGRLLAIDRSNGDRRWFQDNDGFRPTTPIVYEDTVVVPSRKIAAFDVDGGDFRWSSSATFTSPMTKRSGDEVIVADGRQLAKLSLSDGSIVWDWEDRYRTDIPRYNLVVDQNRPRFYGTDGGTLLAVNLETGEPLWAAEDADPIRSIAIVGDDLAYLVATEADNSKVGVIRLSEAEIGWEHIAQLDYDGWEYGRLSTRLVTYEGQILGGTTEGDVVRIDPETGELTGRTHLVDAAIGEIAVRGNRAYFTTDSGLFGLALAGIDFER